MRIRIALTALSAVLLSACSSLPQDWNLPLSGGGVRKPAVLILLQDVPMAQLVASEVVVRLNDEGMQARTLPPTVATATLKALPAANHDAVVISRLRVIASGSSYASPAQIAQNKAHPLARHYSSMSAFHAYAQASMDAVQADSKRRHILESLVFRVPDGTLISSQSRDILEPRSALSYINASTAAINAAR